LQLAREVGSDYLISGALGALGAALILQGDLAGGRQRVEESLRMSASREDEAGQAFSVAEFGRLLALEGQREKGLEYIGLASIQPSIEKFSRNHFVRIVDHVRGDLTDEQVEAALARGAGLELDEVMAELLGD